MAIIKDILFEINEKLKDLDNTKVKDMNEFHDKVEVGVKSVIATYEDLAYCMWHVYLEKDLMRSEEIFNQVLDMKDDKRVSIGKRRGTIIQTRFVISDKFIGKIEEMTVEEFVKYFDKEEKVRKLNEIDESIKEHQIEIEKLEIMKKELMENI